MRQVTIDVTKTGQNIKQLLKWRNKRVKDAQAALGFHPPQAIYMWMRGERMPSIDNLVILADFLDVMVDDIIITKHAG